MQPIPSMRELRTALAIAALSLPATAQLDLLADLAPGRAGSNPRDFIEVGGRTLFVTAESGGVARLWTTDGTANGTSEVALLGSGLSPRAFAIGPRAVLLLGSFDGTPEIWTSDGTPGGTSFVENVGTTSGFIRETQTVGGRLFFVHVEDGAGSADPAVLYATDGQAGGTVQLGRFRSVEDLLAFDDEVLFLGQTSRDGRELWFSDGTAANTRMVVDLAPGTANAMGTDAIAFRGRVYFVKRSGSDDEALWISDGTAGGTRELARFASLTNQLFLVGAATDYIYISANQGGAFHDYFAVHRLDGTSRHIGVEDWLFGGFEFQDRLTCRGNVQGAFGLYELDGAARSLRFADPTGGHRSDDEALVAGSRRAYLTIDGEVWLTGSDVPTIRLNSSAFLASNLRILGRWLYCSARNSDSLWEPFVGPVGAYAVDVGAGGLGDGLRVPSLRGEDPIPGGSITLSLRDAPPLAATALAVGFHPPQPVALSRDALIYVDPARSAVLTGMADLSGDWSTRIDVPNDARLIGERLTLQCLLTGTPNPRGFELSNAVALRIGR